jgi:hypothetical protein
VQVFGTAHGFDPSTENKGQGRKEEGSEEPARYSRHKCSKAGSLFCWSCHDQFTMVWATRMTFIFSQLWGLKSKLGCSMGGFG